MVFVWALRYSTYNNISLAIKYDVYSVPLFILFIEGRESIRIGRNVDLIDLEKNIERYYNYLYGHK